MKWNFLATENSIKLFYTLDITPLGEAGCLSNFYYLLAAQSSIINFKNYSLEKLRKVFSLKTLTSRL